MKLDEAIRQAITELSADGQTLPAAALERLDRLECFDRRAALRFAVRTAIRSGAFERFSAFGEGTDQVAAFVSHFQAHTGFVPELVEEVFTAYARAIGWDERYLPVVCGRIDASDRCEEVAEPLEEYGEKEPAPAWHTLTVAEKIAHLNSVITLDVAKAAVFGATVETPLAVDLDVTGIVMTATLRRIAPMGSCQLQYALYGADDALLAVGVGAPWRPFPQIISLCSLLSRQDASPPTQPPRACTFLSAEKPKFLFRPSKSDRSLNCDFFAKFGERLYLCRRKTDAVVAQLVEHQLPKLRVASSSLVYRSNE